MVNHVAPTRSSGYLLSAWARGRRLANAFARPVGVFCAFSLAGCSVLTDADQFAMRASPASAICLECSGASELRHAPCPPSGTAPGDELRYFALRSLDFGQEPASWIAGYAAGLDRDCSDRPLRTPSACAARDPETSWEPLPDGVDNALGAQVLRTVQAACPLGGCEFALRLNESLQAGLAGLMLVLERWNGTANDDAVGVRLLATAGVAGNSEPRWDGSDGWVAYASGWDPAYPAETVPVTPYNVSQTGYVRDGQLVWDMRQAETLRLYFQRDGAVWKVDLRSAVLVGRLVTAQEPERIEDLSLSGVWGFFDATRQADALAQFVAGCEPQAWCAIQSEVRARLQEAPDMPLPGSAPSAETICDAISVGMRASFVAAKGVETIVPSSEIPAPCAGVAPTCVP